MQKLSDTGWYIQFEDSVKSGRQLFEGSQYLRIEMLRHRPALALCYDFNRCLVRYRILIRSGAPECIVLVAKNTNPSFNRDSITLQAARISIALTHLS